jgi:imidazole glycerol-phosphate synthase subunit HisH
MIGIVDYGMGNLRSVQKALERLGHAARVVEQADALSASDALILPGVGAFGDAMAELQRRDLLGALKQYLREDRPFLGICLGMQLLFDESCEEGRHEGLGIWPGKVARFAAGPGLKVPHMGWNQLRFVRPSPLLEGLADGTHCYFVHSYYVVPDDPGLAVAETTHGATFPAVLSRGNQFATQFHPEKSQADGLRMLENFATWARKVVCHA